VILETAHEAAGGLKRARRLGEVLIDLALPAACAGCGTEGMILCPTCSPALYARLKLPPGMPLGLPAAVPAGLAQLEWCGPFCGTLRSALHRLKYSGERRLAVPLGEAMASRWQAAAAGGDLLVPVPVHRERARKRGYDQAVLLAQVASKGLAIPCRPCLQRSRNTAPQFDLDRRSRRSNVAGAFALSPGEAAHVAGRWPILVDDVVTTGSTLGACAEVLYRAGAVAVSALTVARER
jgi:ComF family protein